MSEAPQPKAITLGSHRSAELEDTIDRALAKASVFGLKRLADLTDLDILRIPNYAAICPTINYPDLEGGFSVFSGKGLTKLHAKASALMEAVERYSARPDGRFTMRGSYRSLSRRYDVIHPSQFIVPGSLEYRDGDAIEWMAARSLVHRDRVLVPAGMAFCPDIPTDPAIRPMRSSSNGLASGNTVEEATLHALYELIERDADVISTYSGRGTAVDLSEIEDAALADIIDRFLRHNVELRVRRVTQDIPVHVFRAMAVDHDVRIVDYINGGHGAHLDPHVALARAVTEASQSRVTVMAGIREDMPLHRKRLKSHDFLSLYNTNKGEFDHHDGVCTFDALPDMSRPTLQEDLQLVVELLVEAGIPDVYVVDLTRPELQIPVVRALVPMLEFEEPGNWMGPRLQRCLTATAEVSEK
jgi:thioglycine synthase